MKRHGFTLIEVMISSLIIAMIFASIYSAFYLGVKTWRKESENESLQRIRVKLLRIQKELKNSFFFSQTPFKGASLEMVFPQAVAADDGVGIYIVRYYLDEDSATGFKKFVRNQRNFKQNPLGEKQEITEVMFLARAMHFEYAYRIDNSSQGFEWQDYWDEAQAKIPSAVKISFEMGNDHGIYNKIILIPQGGLGQI